MSNRIGAQKTANLEIARDLAIKVQDLRTKYDENDVQKMLGEEVRHAFNTKYLELELAYPIGSYLGASGSLEVTNKANNPTLNAKAAMTTAKKQVRKKIV